MTNKQLLERSYWIAYGWLKVNNPVFVEKDIEVRLDPLTLTAFLYAYYFGHLKGGVIMPAKKKAVKKVVKKVNKKVGAPAKKKTKLKKKK